MATKRKGRAKAQSEHARIMEQASRNPGLAEAMAMYEAVASHSVTIRKETPILRYATGGNAPPAQAG